MKSYQLPYLLFFAVLLLWSQTVNAQLELPRASGKAGVWQTIGLTEVKIKYSRPKVTTANGTDRTGEIWGKLVPYGMAPNNFANGPIPWRAGANENTIISFSHPVKIEGKDLEAGTYSFHIMVHENNEEATLIFNTDYHQWGSFSYDESKDVLRVKVKTQEVPKYEILTFEFLEVDQQSAVCALTWEKRRFPFKIETETKAITVERINQQLAQSLGFQWNTYVAAANYVLNNEGDYEQGVKWIDQALNSFGGNFSLYKAKADLLAKLDKKEASDKALALAIGAGSLNDMFSYGQQLLGAQENEKAMEIFLQNAARMKEMKVVGEMDKFMVYAGLAMGYRSNKKLPEAIENAKKAKEVAPNDRLRTMAENFVAVLEKANQKP